LTKGARFAAAVMARPITNSTKINTMYFGIPIYLYSFYFTMEGAELKWFRKDSTQ